MAEIGVIFGYMGEGGGEWGVGKKKSVGGGRREWMGWCGRGYCFLRKKITQYGEVRSDSLV